MDAQPAVLVSFLSQLKLRGVHVEKVVEVRDKRKSSHMRVIAICVPTAVDSTACSSFVVLGSTDGPRGGSRFKLKRQLTFTKVVSLSVRGEADLVMQFRGSDTVTYRFESPVQRDVFHSAAKRALLEADDSEPNRDEDVPDFQGTAVLSAEEEAQVMAAVDAAGDSLSSMLKFDSTLSDRIHLLEMKIAAKLGSSEEEWNALEEDVDSLQSAIASLDDRVGQYANELMTRRLLIESIEHQNNAKRRSQANVAEVSSLISQLLQRLTLPQRAEAVVAHLNRLDAASGVNDFIDREISSLVDAIEQVDKVLSSCGAAWEKNQAPTPAVLERRRLFTEHRLIIAEKVKGYAFSETECLCSELSRDASRVSKANRIILQPPTLLFQKLLPCRSVLRAVKECDEMGYCSLVRHICTSLQPLYSKELTSFLRHVSSMLQKNGWHGGFLVGNSDESRFHFDKLVATGEVCSTIRRGASMSPSQPSPALSYRSGGSIRRSTQPRTFEVLLPSLNVAGVSLLQDDLASTLHNYVLPAPDSMQDYLGGALSFLSGVEGGGTIRPDIGVAMVLSSVTDLVLQQEGLFRDVCHVDSLSQSNAGALPTLLLCMTEVFTEPSRTIEIHRAQRSAGGRRVGWADMSSSSDDEDPQDMGDAPNPTSRDRKTLEIETTSTLELELTRFFETFIDKCDGCYLFSAMAMVECLMKAQDVQESAFLRKILSRQLDALHEAFMKFVSDQTASVHRAALKAVQKNVVYSFFSNFPMLITRIEGLQASLRCWDTNRFEAFVSHLCQQMFTALDELTFVSNSGMLDTGSSPSKHALHKGYLLQFRHCALFMVASSQFTSSTQLLLAPRIAECTKRRERYQALYLEKLIFAEELPSFTAFTNTAEDLVKAYQPSELAFHKAVSQEAFRKLFDGLEKELRRGVLSAGKRIRRHLSAGITTETLDEGFHLLLLRSTWKTFVELGVAKLRLLWTLPELLKYGVAVQCPVSEQYLRDLASAAETSL